MAEEYDQYPWDHPTMPGKWYKKQSPIKAKKMAETETSKETKEKTKKDEVTGDEYVWSEAKGGFVKKTMSPELYRQEKAAQRRQAAIAGGAGLAAEALQFGIGASVFGDPAIKAAGQEKARLAAELRKGPDYLTEAEKQARREAGLAPVQRRAEAVQRRAEKVAASTGDVSVRSLLAAGETGIAQIRQQALETEADIAKEDLTRQQLKEQQDEKRRQGIEEVDAMMLELRNKYIREPLHKFISDAGKLAGTMMAYAPAKSIDEQVAELKKQKVSEQEIAEFIRLARRAGPRRVEKLFNKALGTVPAATEAENEELEMKRQMERADEAIAETRGERREATGDRVVAEGTSILGMTDEEARAASGVDKPTMRDTYKELRINREPVQAMRLLGPNWEDPRPERLFKKRTDDDYSYGFKDGVWTVYRGDKSGSQFPSMKPYISPATGKGVSYTLEEAKNHRNPNVVELYDLAVEKGLVE